MLPKRRGGEGTPREEPRRRRGTVTSIPAGAAGAVGNLNSGGGGGEEMEARRSFFWNGVLQLNETGEHAFFDIRVRKTQDNPPQVYVYTSDVPPLPMKSRDDVLKVTFLLENNVGTTTIRYKIADATFDGKTLESRTSNCNQNSISIVNENSEWHFIKQTNWLLYYISVKIPPDQVKKFMPLL